MTEATFSVTEAARRGRGRAIDEARASCRLEGTDMTPAGQAVAQRCITGELSCDEMIEELAKLFVE